MYRKWVACLFASIALAGVASACEQSEQQASDVSSTPIYTSSPGSSDEMYSVPVQTSPTTQPASDGGRERDPGGVGISASFFL